MIIRNDSGQNPVIQAKKFFLYSKDNEPLAGFKAGREIMSCAGSTLANWIMVLMGQEWMKGDEDAFTGEKLCCFRVFVV